MSNILDTLDGSVWALTEDSLEQMTTFIQNMGRDKMVEVASQHNVEDATRNRGVLQGDDEFKYEGDMYEIEDGTASLSIHGRMYPRANILTSLSGGVSTRKIGLALDEIEAREDAERVLMLFDSPGGSVTGLTNLAQKIRNMETETVSFAEGLMASAAYFVGSAADQIIASPDSFVGSIGSVMTIKSKADKLEDEGIDVEVVRSTPKKSKPNPMEPIGEDDVKEVQRMVNAAHRQFVRQLSLNLDLSEETVSDTMADGSVISGADAEDTNFVDDVKTLDEVLADVSSEADSEDENSAFQALRSEYKDLRQRHEAAIDHIQNLESELDDLKEEQRQAQIDAVVQTAIYDEKKIAPGKEDQLRNQLSENFEATKQAIDLMDAGSAAPSDAPSGDTERDDDPAAQTEAFQALRDAGYKVAPDADAAQTFETLGQDYVKAENAVEVAKENDLL